MFSPSGAPHRPPDIDGRIVGGSDARIEDHPYIVSVLQRGYHHCGGSIISSTWIVSAAHCFTRPTGEYSIRAGSSYRNYGGQVIPAYRILIHPYYLRSTLDYDIALIHLARPITSSIARPIVLASEGNNPSPGTSSIVAGWGALWEGGPLANVLQVVHVPVISQEACRSRYGQRVITERMFCAGLWGIGGMDACQNDSGGPLVANGLLAGIVSWGAGCARPDAPGVYASVPYLRRWIRSSTGV